MLGDLLSVWCVLEALRTLYVWFSIYARSVCVGYDVRAAHGVDYCDACCVGLLLKLVYAAEIYTKKYRGQLFSAV